MLTSKYIVFDHALTSPADASEQNNVFVCEFSIEFDVVVPRRLEDNSGFVRMLGRCMCSKCNKLHM